MSTLRHRIPLECLTEEQLAREYRDNMCRGIVITTTTEDLSVGDACEIVIIHPMTGLMHPLRATVAFKDGQGRSICDIDGFDSETSKELREFIGLAKGDDAPPRALDRQESQRTTKPVDGRARSGTTVEVVPRPLAAVEVSKQPLAAVEVSKQPLAAVEVSKQPLAIEMARPPSVAVEVVHPPSVAVEVDSSASEQKEALFMPVATIKLKRRTAGGEDVIQSPDTSVDGLDRDRSGTAETAAQGFPESDGLFDTLPEAVREPDTVVQDIPGAEGSFDTLPEAEDDGNRVVQDPTSRSKDSEKAIADPLHVRTKVPAHAQERLRGLPLHEAHKVARTGNLAERVALEQIYGKAVWEMLLQNPNLTPPEVARIARMGNLPKPLIDSIVSRAGWLTKSLVRRALLSNPRLSGRALTKVLRALPKSELKLVPQQSAYPYRVRDAANRLLGQ